MLRVLNVMLRLWSGIARDEVSQKVGDGVSVGGVLSG